MYLPEFVVIETLHASKTSSNLAIGNEESLWFMIHSNLQQGLMEK